MRPKQRDAILRAPTLTSEQRLAFRAFRALVAPLRLRVKADSEGFPIAPGRYGRLEWHGDGEQCAV
jgi:hypothetical protein